MTVYKGPITIPPPGIQNNVALLKEAAKNSYVHPENTVTCSFPQPGVFLKPDSGEVKTSLLYLHKGKILKGRGFFLCH